MLLLPILYTNPLITFTPITQLPNYPITQLPNYPITQYPI